jgi:uncharacterized protein DUF4349
MEPPRDDLLAAELRALRPTPRPEFAAELDQRAAAGFPRRSRLRLPSIELRSPRRLLLPAAGVALAAIAIATVLVVSSEPDSHHGVIAQAVEHSRPQPSFGGSGHPSQTAKPGGSHSEEASEVQYETEVPMTYGAEASSAQASGSGEPLSELEPLSQSHRDVERSAEVVLGAEPKDVADDAARVFEAVHASDGIVLRSSTRQGKAGQAGARFDLLIPSAKLADALAAFSEIDSVRSRHEATADITAPTVSTRELLADSRARIDSLLAQLEGAETESEREAVEAELRHERRHAARLAGQLSHLQKRADYSRVSLRIETGAGEESSGGGAWGVDDAFGDAGHILAVAAGVTVVGLAIVGPIALIALLAWLTHRAWLRRERRRALG